MTTKFIGVSPAEARRRLDECLKNAPVLSRDELPNAELPPRNWHLHQKVFPRLVRRPDWRQRLAVVVDQWSMKNYTTDIDNCFSFTCSALDAMIGSRFHEYHWNNLRGNYRGYFRYVQVMAGRDFFDIAGLRTRWQDAKHGDILQVESPTPIRGKVHISYSIKTENPREVMTFTVQGLVVETLIDSFAPYMRIWSPRFAIGAD